MRTALSHGNAIDIVKNLRARPLKLQHSTLLTSTMHMMLMIGSLTSMDRRKKLMSRNLKLYWTVLLINGKSRNPVTIPLAVPKMDSYSFLGICFHHLMKALRPAESIW
jgi:hypothetical protein